MMTVGDPYSSGAPRMINNGKNVDAEWVVEHPTAGGDCKGLALRCCNRGWEEIDHFRGHRGGWAHR